MDTDRIKKAGRPTALLAVGVLAGAVAAGTLAANAADSPTPTPSAGSSLPAPPPDGLGWHSPETALTGATKDKVEAAVLEKYPNATIDRTETDSRGAYQAHITTASGEHLRVLLDEDFAITATEAFMPGHGPGGPGGPGCPGGPGGETPLTGTTKDKVEAAVMAKYPNATIDRAETDATGAYEAHITTASGEHLTVLVDKNYDVTGTETFAGR